jgi:hypothetical protein
MNLGEIYNEVAFLLGKDQYGGYLTPANFQSAINDIVQPELMNAYVREFEQTREIGIDLRPFIKTLGDNVFPPLTLTPWSANSDFSYGAFPSDFWYFARANHVEFLNKCGVISRTYRSVTWMEQHEFDYVIGTELLFPDTECPAATIQNDQILVCPALTALRFTYLRTPADVVFDYDIVSGNTVLYLPPGTFHAPVPPNPNGLPSLSVELEWPESVHAEIVRRLVQYYGRNIQSQLDMTIPNKKP